jgi:hypothetical protein
MCINDTLMLKYNMIVIQAYLMVLTRMFAISDSQRHSDGRVV